jgi:hypothetical protein
MLMPDRTNHLKDLILELTRARVRFIVAGGVAMVLHGIERMTVDLDIMLDFEPENVDRFLVCASRLGLTPRAPVSADILRDREKITELVEGKNALVFTFIDTGNPYRQLDVFISPELDYSRFTGVTRPVAVDGETIQVLSPEALLELKLRIKEPREKDLFDIKALKAMLDGSHGGK